MSLMSDNGDIREDLRVPENEVGKEIESKFEAGEEFMVSVESPSGAAVPVLTRRSRRLFPNVTRVGVKFHMIDSSMLLLSAQVTVISAMGEECAVATKVLASK